jgi:hypothetical protein
LGDDLAMFWMVGRGELKERAATLLLRLIEEDNL